MDAESFYDTLLASIGHNGREGVSVRTEEASHLPADKAVIKPTSAPVHPPPPVIKTEVLQPDSITCSPETISPVNTTVVKTEYATPRNYEPPATLTSPTFKSSTQLEAELRAKLLASTKKRKAQGASRPLALPPSQRPPRGSPVFTTVPLASRSSVDDALSKQANVPHSPVSPSFPAPEISPASQQHRRLALPPKLPQRDGFKLRIKLPFSFAGSSFITLETDKLPLTTPISAILDLFNRRSPLDHLYFAPPSPHDDNHVPNPAGRVGDEEDVGLGIPIDSGQRFYRDPPRNTGSGGWRDAAPSRGGPNWDPGVGNLRATLEDVTTVYGAEVVECEIRCDLRPKSPHRRGSGGGGGGSAVDSKQNNYCEEEDAEEWQDAEPEDEWVSPVMGAGQWDYNMFVAPGRWDAAMFAGMPMSMDWMPAIPGIAAYPQHLPLQETEPEHAQRWIPGHQDYNDAGWRFGFGRNDPVESALPNHPLPPHIDPTPPVASTATAGPTPPIPTGPRTSSIPSHAPPRQPATENKKNKKRGGGGGKKKHKGSSAKRGGQGRGGGNGGGIDGGAAADSCA